MWVKETCLIYLTGRGDDQGSIFRTFFSGENFGENSAENFPPKMLGKKGIYRGKSFEKSFFQEIPRNFPRKVIFRGKMYEKSAPDEFVNKSPEL
jgi:hypothetical protein